MNKKKIILLIVINIFLILFIIIGANFYVLYQETKSFDKVKNFIERDISEQATYNLLISSNQFRRVENINSDKKPVLIFGCSFAEGTDFEDNQTLSYKLGKLTGRPVYNRARACWGVQHMYYQLLNEDFYKIVKKPEYIIYVYFEGHPLRIFTPAVISFDNCYSVFYKKTNKGFVRKKRTFFSDKIVLQHYLRNHFTWNFLTKFPKYNIWEEQKILDYLLASKKAVEEHWGDDVKFVILVYADMHNEELINELKKNGFIFITKEDLPIDIDDIEYRVSESDQHPNEKAWDAVVPVIVEKLKL